MALLSSALIRVPLLMLLAGCSREVEDPRLTDPQPETATPAMPDELGMTGELAPAERAAIERLLEDQRGAWNRGDLDGFLAAYEPSEQLLFTSGAKIRRGFEETRTKYRERYGSATKTMGQLAFEVLDVRGLGPRAAIVLGRYEVRESPEASEGVFTLVLVREGEAWKIVHDHTSAAPAPAPAPAPADPPATETGE